jgi:hypothetical protein
MTQIMENNILPCGHCGAVAPPRIEPGTGPHHAKAVCGHCGRFLKWMPKPAKPPIEDFDPVPGFTTCACGALVAVQVWVMATKEDDGYWRTLPAPVTPALGLPHLCPEETT